MKQRAANISYRRMLAIDKAIALGSYPSTAQLAAQAEVSPATVKRDIEQLRLFLKAPLAYSKRHEGWYYENPTYRLPALFIDEKQYIAAALARQFIESLHETTAYEVAKGLLLELTSPIPNPLGAQSSVDTNWIDKRIIFLEGSQAPAKPETWHLVTECIRHNFELNFLYKGLHDKQHIQRRVQPYQLIHSMQTWTLWGYDTKSRKKRLFRLSRMNNPSITKNHFQLPLHYDYREAVDGTLGTWVSDTRHRFKISFLGIEAALALERSWGVEQVIAQNADGSITVEFFSSQFELVLSQVLSCGLNAVPLEPKGLVDEWKDTIKRIAEKHIQSS